VEDEVPVALCFFSIFVVGDFVYVVGDMWEGTYRRETIPPPAITAGDVATMISGTQTSNDPTLVTQIVQDLTSKDTSVHRPCFN
jgi:hypothetical protein